MPKGAAGFFIFGTKPRCGPAVTINLLKLVMSLCRERDRMPLRRAGATICFRLRLIGGMDKLVDENGPRRKDWGYGTLNRRMLLVVIAGPLSGPAKSKQKE